ncbi:hypothetical protein L1887_57925 [Cichorium endivia]|nr:hypothetical protein L1887_57925 [Cichorium endivia]
MVVGDVDQQIRLFKVLEVEGAAHGVDHLASRTRHLVRPDDDAALDVALLHDADELAHRLDAHIALHRVEYKQPLVLVRTVLREEVELRSVNRAARRRILGLERLEVNVDLVVRHLVPAVAHQLVDRLVHAPQSHRLPVVLHDAQLSMCRSGGVDLRGAAEKRAVAGVGVGAESTAKPEMSSREGRDGGGRADGMRFSSAAQGFGKFLELSARLGAEALPAFISTLQSNIALFGAHRLHPGTSASYEGPCIAMNRCQCNGLMPPPRASNSTLDALDQQATL